MKQLFIFTASLVTAITAADYAFLHGLWAAIFAAFGM